MIQNAVVNEFFKASHQIDNHPASLLTVGHVRRVGITCSPRKQFRGKDGKGLDPEWHFVSLCESLPKKLGVLLIYRPRTPSGLFRVTLATHGWKAE